MEMFDRLWCFHDEVPRNGPVNMALDEQMLEFAAAAGEPALRTYRWSKPFVSMGYFDRASAVEAQFPGRPLVRRWTGGGAVDHRADFTFSLAIPAAHPLARRTGAQRYCEIHHAVAAALKRCGVQTHSAGRVPAVARGVGPTPCFDAVVHGDLMSSGGRKIVGGAQRRTRQGVLHQGSIQAGELAADWCALGGALAAAFAAEPIAWRADAELFGRALALADSKYDTAAWLHAR